jgi:hypothetical protein
MILLMAMLIDFSFVLSSVHKSYSRHQQTVIDFSRHIHIHIRIN